MQKNESKLNQWRKPLGDLSNSSYISSKSKKKMKKNMMKPLQNEIKVSSEDSLDRLILAQSDFSSIFHQLEEIIAQAVQQKINVYPFIQSFSEMLSSLKPWVPKLQKLIPSTVDHNSSSPSTENRAVNIAGFGEKTATNSMISPSPLVSWRAGCTVESGRPLFMLTPLPISKAAFSSRLHPSSKPAHPTAVSFLETMPEPPPSKNGNPTAGIGRAECSPVFSGKCSRSTVTMSPCIKMSPMRSCLLLEPVPGADGHPGDGAVRRRSLDLSDSPICEVSKSLAMKYKEITGEKTIRDVSGRRRTVEDSPGWLLSPLKTCVLMDPPVGNNGFAVHVSQWKLQSLKKGDIHCCGDPERTPLRRDGDGGRWMMGKDPGETTLKRELWTRFDAASIHESAFTNCRPFLEKLDEAEAFLHDHADG